MYLKGIALGKLTEVEKVISRSFSLKVLSSKVFKSFFVLKTKLVFRAVTEEAE